MHSSSTLFVLIFVATACFYSQGRHCFTADNPRLALPCVLFFLIQMADYLSARHSPARPTGQCICRHCDMNPVENEQHFLFYCPLYTGIRQRHNALFGPARALETKVAFASACSAMLTNCLRSPTTFTFQARMSDESHLALQPGL